MHRSSPLLGAGFPEWAEPLAPANAEIRRCPTPAAQARTRILIQRTFANGDILMGTPLLAALRHHWPDAHITWCVERREREVIEANPLIDRLLLWDTRYWKSMPRRGLYPLLWLRAAALRRVLRPQAFDVFISLQPEDYPFLVRAVSAPVSIGVFDTFRQYHGNRPTSRNARLYTHAFTYADLPEHRAEQYLLPLKALGLSETTRQFGMGYTQSDSDAVDAFLRDNGLQGEDFALIAPVTGWPSRNWPQERYAEVCERLYRDLRVPSVIIGAPKEAEDAHRLRDRLSGDARSRCVIAAGTFGFRGLAALMARGGLLIGGDSGPMHLAAAVGTPFVAVFGPTPVSGRVPFVRNGVALSHPVPCGPCDRKQCRFPANAESHMACLRHVSTDDVLAHAKRVFRRSLTSSLSGKAT